MDGDAVNKRLAALLLDCVLREAVPLAATVAVAGGILEVRKPNQSVSVTNASGGGFGKVQK